MMGGRIRKVKDDESLNSNNVYMAFFNELKRLVEDNFNLEDNILRIEKKVSANYSAFSFYSYPCYYVKEGLGKSTGSQKIDEELEGYFNSRVANVMNWDNHDDFERAKNHTLYWMQRFGAVWYGVKIDIIENGGLHIIIDVATDCDKTAYKHEYYIDDVIFDKEIPASEDAAIQEAQNVANILDELIVPLYTETYEETY